ncbi:hypothetical protein C2845_PM02G36410 [Panicum miliaceum]|uniref:Cyclin-dependent kinase inhibitor domain-containing protein n=1 Tax=Panicum miliaceum TaxID=4540 RepID=A0A3L6S6V7_PANMI|nr:hypothetical protein C2845_PM02G36410 [Panicum miliaceum]
MGKYMRKGKESREVAVMEVPGGALLGVRTRSRTLALQRAQTPPDKGEVGEAAGDYLELRSRRLEKPHKEQAAPAPAPKKGAARKAAAAVSPALAEDEVEVSFGENVLDFDAMERATKRHAIGKQLIISRVPIYQSDASIEYLMLVSCLGSLALGMEMDHPSRNANMKWSFPSISVLLLKLKLKGGLEEYGVCEVTMNGLVVLMAWNTRETTPCSLIRSSDMISTPGSTTKSKTSNSMTSRRRMEASVCRFIPSSLEMEEFFTAAEQHEQDTFREKYNFCPVNDSPLPGRRML